MGDGERLDAATADQIIGYLRSYDEDDAAEIVEHFRDNWIATED